MQTSKNHAGFVTLHAPSEQQASKIGFIETMLMDEFVMMMIMITMFVTLHVSAYFFFPDTMIGHIILSPKIPTE